MIYSDLPEIDYCYMPPESVKAVMDEFRPYERVELDKLADFELDEIIGAWLSALPRVCIEEFKLDTITSDPFFVDTYLSLFKDAEAYADRMTELAREKFKAPCDPTSLNPHGLSLAKRMVANMNAVLEADGTIEEAA